MKWQGWFDDKNKQNVAVHGWNADQIMKANGQLDHRVDRAAGGC